MKNRIAKNTTALAIFHISKIIFPFLTLPYLTRVLTTDAYGTVTYAKTTMTYMQVLVDFGFLLSATKDIVRARNNRSETNSIINDTLLARIVLASIGFVIVFVLTLALPILRGNFIFSILSYVPIFGSIFLLDFLFRGIEKMHIITIRFVLMKTISTVLTFIFIKDDSQLLLIPILDIIATVIAIVLVYVEVKKMNYTIRFGNLRVALRKIRESFVYFLSSMASTSFNALSTIIIGIFLSKTDVAFWGVCMQIIGTIQSCYSPLSDGIYPEMVKSRNIAILRKVMRIFLPVVAIGCVVMISMAGTGLSILGGEKYASAAFVLQLLTPCLFFGFCAIMLGWPALGAIDKNREVTISTVISIALHAIVLGALILTNNFSLINIAISRVVADATLFLIRFYFLRKNIKLFKNERV